MQIKSTKFRFGTLKINHRVDAGVNITVKENTLSHRDKVISNKNTNNLSPHNSDLNPKDYYLFGLMNNNVHVNRSQSIAALKDEIQ